MFKCILKIRFADLKNEFPSSVFFEKEIELPFVPSQELKLAGIMGGVRTFAIERIVWDCDYEKFKIDILDRLYRDQIETALGHGWVVLDPKAKEFFKSLYPHYVT